MQTIAITRRNSVSNCERLLVYRQQQYKQFQYTYGKTERFSRRQLHYFYVYRMSIKNKPTQLIDTPAKHLTTVNIKYLIIPYLSYSENHVKNFPISDQMIFSICMRLYNKFETLGHENEGSNHFRHKVLIRIRIRILPSKIIENVSNRNL